jgi:hypothetical protein
MKEQIQQRLDQLASRLRKLVFKHKQVHRACFPKDGTDGVYQKTQKARDEFYQKHKEEYDKDHYEIFKRKDAPVEFDQTFESIYMGRLRRITDKIRREMLAILYYQKIMDTDQGIFSLLQNTSGTINKYRYLFDGQIDLSLIYPKTEEEIVRIKMSRLEKMKAFPKEQDYSMFTQEGNLLVNDMMINLLDLIHGEKKIDRDELQYGLNTYVNNIESVGHVEIHDTAVREVVLHILEKEVSKAGYNFSMEIEI